MKSLVNWESIDWNTLIPELLLYAHRRLHLMPHISIGLSAGDLVHTAIEKTMQGVRNWNPERVDLIGHLRGVIKSDFYNEVRKNTATYNSSISIDNITELASTYGLPNQEPIISAEQEIINKEQEILNQDVLRVFLKNLKAHDHHAYELCSVSIAYGISDMQVAEYLGYKKKDVLNTRKRLNRFIRDFSDKRFDQKDFNDAS